MRSKDNIFFSAKEIDESIFKRIDGLSFRENPVIQVSDLSYIPILHCGFDRKVHEGEIICNRAISDRLIAVFRLLYEKRYRIESIRLIDDFSADDNMSMAANNTSCFNYRPITHGDKLSYHALGLAIDINPLYNPYVRLVDGYQIVLPAESLHFADRTRKFPHKITHSDLAYQVFTQNGFSWGGDWETLKDYQHFEISL